MKSKFLKELKRQSRLAIAAAIGFLIAYAWKDYVLELAFNMFQDLKQLTPIISDLLSAIFLTAIGVLLILLSSRLLE
ncbi:MAG: DUF5654 family protein [Candidatus Pacearchaeota archaeon]|nr:DUF5654 family protein [Candidatus Pacearchaeota archaeon]